MIGGVQVIPLKRIPDERGTVSHMLKRTDPHFREFGEVYFSSVYPGVVKGWHLHKVMTLNYACVVGAIRLALYDEREGSPTRGRVQEIVLGEANYLLAIVPPGVWNGFVGTAPRESIVANCATHPHDPGEIVRIDPYTNHIPYEWKKGLIP